ncbi:MAG: PA2169 family four-helix-bundle protein [Alphaproteobacteria bacterium]|nr:PA2169 family four-helix-bundle protein [Alphaproteobacteria bacterium]
MAKDDVIATLNDLIEISKDGEQGFRTCTESVKNAQLKGFFEQAARRCAQGAAELQAKVRELGGDPERSGSTAGALRLSWVNIKSAITGMDDNAILAECERGEDSAKDAYESALKQDLPADVRATVERQYREVKQNHDRVKGMRNATA